MDVDSGSQVSIVKLSAVWTVPAPLAKLELTIQLEPCVMTQVRAREVSVYFHEYSVLRLFTLIAELSTERPPCGIGDRLS